MLGSAEANKKEDTEALRALVYAPKPEYPYKARALNIEGSGRFRALVNPETGAVSEVIVTKTTGHRVLDDAVVLTLRKWRLKPHTFKEFDVPINFSMSGWMEDELRAARVHTTFAPAPVIPFSIWMSGLGGHGVFQLKIDPQTGRVTDVMVLETTRHGRLDDASVKAFRQWRFVPHTVDSVTIPLTF